MATQPGIRFEAKRAPAEMRVDVGFAWWFWPYFWGLVAMVIFSGGLLCPDYKKLEATMLHAIRIRIGDRAWQPLIGEARVTWVLNDWTDIEVLPRLNIKPPRAELSRNRWGIGVGWLNFWVHLWL